LSARQQRAKLLARDADASGNHALFHSQETPMTQRRQRLADFEARSVQLLAACTLGLAGMASAPPSHAARITGQASLTGTTGHTNATGNGRASRVPAVLLPAGKVRR
jgi:hypothetical protein